jgi:hypothetical protein
MKRAFLLALVFAIVVLTNDLPRSVVSGQQPAEPKKNPSKNFTNSIGMKFGRVLRSLYRGKAEPFL